MNEFSLLFVNRLQFSLLVVNFFWNLPLTVLHCEPSPLQTPHSSSFAEEFIFPSQPTCWRKIENGIIAFKFAFHVHNDIGKVFVYIGHLPCICHQHKCYLLHHKNMGHHCPLECCQMFLSPQSNLKHRKERTTSLLEENTLIEYKC